MKKFHSAEDGTFTVSLPPGRYLIQDDPKFVANGILSPVEVNVRAGEFEEVDLYYTLPMG